LNGSLVARENIPISNSYAQQEYASAQRPEDIGLSAVGAGYDGSERTIMSTPSIGYEVSRGEGAGAADPNYGHCVVGMGYMEESITIAIWGITGLFTDAAITAYDAENVNSELDIVISHDKLNKASKERRTV
jgi:hypothetical protein